MITDSAFRQKRRFFNTLLFTFFPAAANGWRQKLLKYSTNTKIDNKRMLSFHDRDSHISDNNLFDKLAIGVVYNFIADAKPVKSTLRCVLCVIVLRFVIDLF